MRISDWSSDVCSSDLLRAGHARGGEDFRGIEPARVGNGHHHRAIRRGPVDSKGGGRESAVRHRPWVAKNRAEIQPVRQFVKSLALESGADDNRAPCGPWRSEEHTSELQSLMRISYAVFCLKKKKQII